MAKFSNGDVVVVLNDHQSLGAPVGRVGIVTETGSRYPYVRFPGWTKGHSGNDADRGNRSSWAMSENAIVLLTEHFDKGTRVQCVAPVDGDGTLVGLNGTVVDLDPAITDEDLLTVKVEFDNGDYWWCEAHNLKVIEPKAKGTQFIVGRVTSSGGYALAPNPYIHPTYEDAEKEARRLANTKHGTFRVIEFKPVLEVTGTQKVEIKSTRL